jgi:hypothetical protein
MRAIRIKSNLRTAFLAVSVLAGLLVPVLCQAISIARFASAHHCCKSQPASNDCQTTCASRTPATVPPVVTGLEAPSHQQVEATATSAREIHLQAGNPATLIVDSIGPPRSILKLISVLLI